MTVSRKSLQNLAIAALLGLGVQSPGSAWANEERLFVLAVDSETIDSDIPAIEQAAASNGVSPFDLINDGDGPSTDPNLPLLWNTSFPGDEVWLPTGQAGDEGLFALPQALHSNQTGADFTLEAFVAGIVGQSQEEGGDDAGESHFELA